MLTSNETLRILKVLPSIEFKPFNQLDFYAFADADFDAQMGEPKTFELDRVISDLVGENVTDSIVVISGPNIEIHASTNAHDDVCLKFSADRIC